ncbi:MAG: HAD hydrolase-like protein [Moraxellaceae bacterium]|nr:HAD hydrolase-like protein [Moraxellaceae bacterium]
MIYRVVAFDFDGTLADTFPFFMKVFNTLADAHGFRRVGHDEAEALRGRDARDIMKHVGLPLWKFPRVALQFKAMMAAEIDGIALFDGVGDMLKALEAHGVTLAIVSSNSEANVRRVLGEHATRIAHYACGASLLGKRQHLRELRRLGPWRAAETLYVGDELRDAEAAQAEGMAFGAVAWGYTRFEALRATSPQESFASVADITAACT